MLSLLQAENEKQMKQSEGRFKASVILFKPVKSNLIMYRLMCKDLKITGALLIIIHTLKLGLVSGCLLLFNTVSLTRCLPACCGGEKHGESLSLLPRFRACRFYLSIH